MITHNEELEARKMSILDEEVEETKGAATKEITKKDIKAIKRIVNYNRQIKAPIKIGRNELCPCGSRLKYKRCHGRG